MKVLIVEDEPTNQKLLVGLLSRHGECFVANDGEEGVKSIRESFEKKEPYDLVCMDIMMPNKDGHQALKELRDIEQEFKVHPSKETKVVMVTALKDPKNVVKAYYRGGAAAYLPKPIEKDALEAILRDLGLIDE